MERREVAPTRRTWAFHKEQKTVESKGQRANHRRETPRTLLKRETSNEKKRHTRRKRLRDLGKNKNRSSESTVGSRTGERCEKLNEKGKKTGILC